MPQYTHNRNAPENRRQIKISYWSNLEAIRKIYVNAANSGLCGGDGGSADRNHLYIVDTEDAERLLPKIASMASIEPYQSTYSEE